VKALERYSKEKIRAFYDAGQWRDVTLPGLLSQMASGHGDKVFVADSTKRLTYGEVRELAYRFAGNLREIGVEPGDRVVVQLPNWSEFVVVYFGIVCAGAVLVPMMPIYRENEVAYVFNHSGAKVLVIPNEFRGFHYAKAAQGIRDQCPQLKDVILVRSRGQEGMSSLEDILAKSSPVSQEELGGESKPDDLHVILYTSGTESRPKGCMHTWNTFSYTPRVLGEVLGLTSDDFCFMPSPVTHTTGIAMGIAAPFLSGASTFLMDKWDADEALEIISREHCTYSIGAAPFLRMMLDVYNSTRHALSSFRVYGCGGAPVSGDIIREAQRQFNCAVATIYGQSETQVATATRLDDLVEKVAMSDGRSAPGVDVAILNENGEEVVRGEDGEICHKGPGLMMGYWRDPELTAKTIDANGWCHSGDLGRMDEEGYVRVSGRAKDIIIRGGVNISAREIEEHLTQHPKVSAVAVVSMPDRKLGEKACAYLVPVDEPPTLEELISFLKNQRIAVQKLPERLEVVESLPLTATGKVKKSELRQDIARRLGASL